MLFLYIFVATNLHYLKYIFVTEKIAYTDCSSFFGVVGEMWGSGDGKRRSNVDVDA